MNNKEEKNKVSRRDFLGKAAIWTFIASIGTSILGMLRLPKPSVFPDPMMKVKIGHPDVVPVGTTIDLPEHNLLVCHDDDGFYAISKVCTHLGCIVNVTQEGFVCPCHGSEFTAEGKVKGGPAPRPLEWVKIGLAPDGSLVANLAEPTKVGTKFKL